MTTFSQLRRQLQPAGADFVIDKHLAFGIVGGGAQAETNGGLIGFIMCNDGIEQTRGMAECDDQRSGGHRIKCAGVTDFLDMQRAAHGGHCIETGHALRLVDDEQAAWSCLRHMRCSLYPCLRHGLSLCPPGAPPSSEGGCGETTLRRKSIPHR